MRDKHISARPADNRQKHPVSKVSPGRQRFSSGQTRLAQTLRFLLHLLPLLLIFAILPNQAIALNQIRNGYFSNALGLEWERSKSASTGTPDFERNLNALWLRYSNSGGSPHLVYNATAIAKQTILSSPRSTNVNAIFTASYFEVKTNPGQTSFTHIGSVRKTSSPDVTIPRGDFHYEHKENGVVAETTKVGPNSHDMVLEANTSYIVHLYYYISTVKDCTTQIWLDDITCNISPSGLSGIETPYPVSGSARGGYQLNWDTSTGTIGLMATSPYRIYCSYTSENGPWDQIATITSVASTSYTASPTNDVAWYAVSDVDVSGVESPLSLPVSYRTARLQITKVEATTDSVTKGQDGVPVKIYVTNTGSGIASFSTVELLFDNAGEPQNGIYSIGAPSPSLPLTLNGGESTVITLLVDVGLTSVSGIDNIDARVTGTNWITKEPITDNDSDIKDSWQIQEKPDLKIIDITASPTVYLDQTGAGVYVTVRNDGEAPAVWDLWNDAELYFTHGTYLNQRPYGVPNPYSEVILTGQTRTIRFDIDISPLSATGTSSINASMSYIDGNTYDSFRYDLGDPTPPSWTIRSGILKTYRGPIGFPSWTIESSSFNLGNFTVYAKGMNLQPDREYRMRWYKGSTQFADLVSTDLDGILFNSFTLSGDPSYLGRWRVIVSRVTNEIPLCETYFDVVDPASLSIQLLMPDFVTVNQPFQITSRLVNSGGSRIDTAYASALVLADGNTGTATLASGPSHNLVTVEPYSYTDITWDYTASTTGTFAVKGSGYGVDSNDLRNLKTATQTSNTCTIQAPPALTVNNVYAAETTVFLNQQNLIVTMDVENTGSASIWLNVASLTFSPGIHFQTLESPVMPYLLASNTTTTFTYRVAVATNSPTGISTIGGFASGIDANWPTSPPISKANTASYSWTISDNNIVGYCAIDPGFTMEQYTFNVGQQVWAKYTDCPAGGLRVIYRVATITTNPDGSEPVVANTDAPAGIRLENYIVPGPAGNWKTELFTMSGKSSTPQTTVYGRQFFRLQNPGSITAELTFEPDDIELYHETTLVLKISNNVTLGSTIENILPADPLKYSTGSGTLKLLSGPEPAELTLSAGSTASFTWRYWADDEHTGPGTMQYIASATGNDANLLSSAGGYATSGVALATLKIRYRALSYASPTIDFGTMVCGETKIVGTSRVNNLGSTDLTRTSWNKGFYESELADLLHPSQLTMYPLSGFTVPYNTATSSYAELHMPYNQPAGTYIATMSVFEDMPPYNGVLDAGDAGEPNYPFINSIVIASHCRVIYTLPEIISLGDWKIGNTIATKTIRVFNGGNLPLEKVKIKKVTPTDFTLYATPTTAGDMSLTASQTISISGYVSALATDSDYIIDFVVWEDLNNDGDDNDGRARAIFQVAIGIGTQLMHFTTSPLSSPPFIDFGNATPTEPLPDASFKITNIGDKPLNCLKYIIGNMYSIATPAYFIPADEIEFTLPASIAVGATETASISIFIPAGTPWGTYIATATIFEDEDGDGTYIGDDNEAPEKITLQLYVVPYRGLKILTQPVDAGPVSKLDNPLATPFLIKSTGNMELANIGWQKVPLSLDGAGVTLISTSSYDFDPQPTLAANTIYPATMTLQVPNVPEILDGDYIGNFAFVYDDLPPAHPNLVGDPVAPFPVACQVGTRYIDIVDTHLKIDGAIPSMLSDSAPFTIENIGTLMLNRPMATASALVGPETIPATASIFIPSVFDYMIKNKTLTGTWQVNVPPGTKDGKYIGTITVWNDNNGNSRIDDPAEASDTATLELNVIPKTVIGVSPTTLNFGTVAPERSSAVSFSIVNLGNQPISNDIQVIASWLPPLAAGVAIPAAQIQFDPVPFATNLALYGSATVVATITIPAGQATGIYQGTQRAYVDSDAPSGSYTAGEVTATFTARVQVGLKQLSVADVDMGNHAHATTAVKSFDLSNTGNINANSIRWIPQNMSDGTTTLTPILPANTSVAAGVTVNRTISVTIPQYTPPGVYTGIQTVYDDDLAPFGSLDPSREASDTFLLTLTVDPSPGLIITDIDPDPSLFPINLGLGQKTVFNVTCQNTGNVTFAADDLVWAPLSMSNLDGSGATMMLTYSPANSIPVPPGGTYIASITVEAAADQATGTYAGVQTLSSTAHPVTVNFNPSVLVVAQTGPKNLEKGTVFQNIATATFAAGGDFIFSVYVGFEDGLPASGTIGFRQDKTDDNPSVPMSFVTIDQSGNVIAENPPGAGGVTSSIKSGNKTWYRLHLHLKFPTGLDPATESTYLILSNSSSSTIPKVWFDGVQLERANGRDRPTSFGEGSKIISPNNRIDLEGKSRYSDW